MKPTITAIVKDKKGNVLSVAQNSWTKTHPVQAKAAKEAGQPLRIFLHAEIAALLKCDLSKAHSVHVFRYGANGMPANAKPCPVCSLFMEKAGIRKVFHT